MTKMIAIGGMPRSGSTLLCNILNQNPRFHASSTSPLPGFISGLVHQWSNSVEVKAELNTNKEQAEERSKQALIAFIQKWHAGHDKEVVFDKSRGWNINALLWFDLFPDSNIIVPVRDLRSILASCEKQHRKTPLFDEAQLPIGKTMLGRANKLFADDGVIGSALVGVEDMLRIPDKRVVFVQYESLVREPDVIIGKLYESMGEEPFEHDFNNVQDTSTDPDGFYLHKYPHHNATGEIKPQATQSFTDFLSQDVTNEVMKRGQFYNSKFGYV